MECPVCGLISPPDTVACDCGYDFTKRTGGKWTPFRKRLPEAFILASLLTFFVLLTLTFRALLSYPKPR